MSRTRSGTLIAAVGSRRESERAFLLIAGDADRDGWSGSGAGAPRAESPRASRRPPLQGPDGKGPEATLRGVVEMAAQPVFVTFLDDAGVARADERAVGAKKQTAAVLLQILAALSR